MDFYRGFSKRNEVCEVADTRTKITLETFKHVPWWTWIFIVVCAAIPVSTLGGAIPTVITILGIVLCVRVVLLPSMKLPLKLILCTLIVATAWAIAWFSVFLFQQI